MTKSKIFFALWGFGMKMIGISCYKFADRVIKNVVCLISPIVKSLNRHTASHVCYIFIEAGKSPNQDFVGSMCSAGHIRYHSEPSVITLYMQISYEYFRRGLLKEERDRDAESREKSAL